MINPTVDVLIQLGLMLVVGAVVGVALITIAHLFAPGSTNPNKGLPYECGVVPLQDVRMPLNVHYYLVAVLFVLFDLEAVFMYPWAINLRRLGGLGLWEMLVFIAILLVGYVYAWRKGVLEWE